MFLWWTFIRLLQQILNPWIAWILWAGLVLPIWLLVKPLKFLSKTWFQPNFTWMVVWWTLIKYPQVSAANCIWNVFSSTGLWPAGLGHGLVFVVRPSLCWLLFQTYSFLKLIIQFWWNFTGMFLPWSSSDFFERIWFLQKLWLPWHQNLRIFKIFENLRGPTWLSGKVFDS